LSSTKTPYVAGDREMLPSCLPRQRDLVVWKLDGMSDDDAGRVATASGSTVRGIVRHLEDAERSWLRRWFAGRQGLPVHGIDGNHVGEPRAPQGARPTCRRPTSRSPDEVVATHGPDDVAAKVPRTLRWILHHLVDETARHLGHLDLLCELADGTTGEEPARTVARSDRVRQRTRALWTTTVRSSSTWIRRASPVANPSAWVHTREWTRWTVTAEFFSLTEAHPTAPPRRRPR
jgi:hypothetical protein